MRCLTSTRLPLLNPSSGAPKNLHVFAHAPIHVLVITPLPHHHHRHHHWGSAVRNSNWHGELTAAGLDATERRKAALAFAHGQTQASFALCPSILHPSIRQLSRAACRPPPHCAPTAFPPQQQNNPRPPVGLMPSTLQPPRTPLWDHP